MTLKTKRSVILLSIFVCLSTTTATFRIKWWKRMGFNPEIARRLIRFFIKWIWDWSELFPMTSDLFDLLRTHIPPRLAFLWADEFLRTERIAWCFLPQVPFVFEIFPVNTIDWMKNLMFVSSSAEGREKACRDERKRINISHWNRSFCSKPLLASGRVKDEVLEDFFSMDEVDRPIYSSAPSVHGVCLRFHSSIERRSLGFDNQCGSHTSRWEMNWVSKIDLRWWPTTTFWFALFSVWFERDCFQIIGIMVRKVAKHVPRNKKKYWRKISTTEIDDQLDDVRAQEMTG